jgi:hypothetical protein
LIVTAPIAGQLDSIEQVVQKIDGSSGDGGYTFETFRSRVCFVRARATWLP